MRPSRFHTLTSAVDPGGAITRYFDPISGCHLVVARPADHPELWRAYLDGARSSYRKHGVESVLEYDQVVDGESTAIFFVALTADGQIAGGMRAQGPYRCVSDAHALSEWAGRPGTAELRAEIAERIPDGVIEMKTGWVSDLVENRTELTAALARIFVHALTLLDVRYAMGTVAKHAVARWQTTGGVVSDDVTPVAYPDERYLTQLMWWDSATYADLADAGQLPPLMDEAAQLTGADLGLQTVGSELAALPV